MALAERLRGSRTLTVQKKEIDSRMNYWKMKILLIICCSEAGANACLPFMGGLHVEYPGSLRHMCAATLQAQEQQHGQCSSTREQQQTRPIRATKYVFDIIHAEMAVIYNTGSAQNITMLLRALILGS